MYRHNFLALFSILTIFLLIGCVEEPIETNNKEIVSEETSISSETREEADDPSTTREERENQDNDSRIEVSDLSELKIHYIDVGQADSTLLQFSDNGETFTILIDAGDWNRNDVVNYLDSQNVSHIDIAIGTHPDADHIGQLDKVLNAFEVGEVWLSGNTSNSQTFQRLLAVIDLNGVDYYEPRMGDEFEIGPLKIDVLYPKTISEKDNEESISLKLTYGQIRFIFTGDAGMNDEEKMINSGFNLQADFLQLGHHGSSTSTHASFLNEVNPEIAIYSAGLDNNYGHPHDEVVNLVQTSGIQLYGTDVHGTIVVTTDGVNYKVLTNKDGLISPINNNDTTDSDSFNNQNSNSKPPQPNNSCIDVNSATLEQIQEIIHIGTARAEELINLRPYDSVEGLSRISGIGPARIKDIKSQGLACTGG